METALFRIAQEALNNVAKHANADAVSITFDVTDSHVRLSIADDGTGFDVSTAKRKAGIAHWGLLTMQERAVSVDGSLRLDLSPGQGTRVAVEIERQKP